ncbi:hypothetical protein [Nonomuraea sp. NPDC050786]|uniref:hypothetical protein n=1 Tax=Nonomuraea sp. NPDC050786 TaxID=3154840 RepID=UPI0033DE313C
MGFIEGLALRKPKPGVATIHRQARSMAKARGRPVPGYWTVHSTVTELDGNPSALATALAFRHAIRRKPGPG